MLQSILGGVLIGLAVTIMLLFNGRVTGVSSILGGVVSPKKEDLWWRVFFIMGLMLGGLLLKQVGPEYLTVNEVTTNWYDYVISGLLVGFGTLLGNGCTSGHGICGISRFSARSILATVTFILSGIVSVLIFKLVRGGL